MAVTKGPVDSAGNYAVEHSNFVYVIDKEGKITDLKVLKGQPVLARAAVDAVRQWRYKPYKLDGKPVKMSTTITVKFALP